MFHGKLERARLEGNLDIRMAFLVFRNLEVQFPGMFSE
jgi:hypothetical protein